MVTSNDLRDPRAPLLTIDYDGEEPAAKPIYAPLDEAIATPKRKGFGLRTMGGNALRAAVLGANDGLVSNFSLVMGVAGAELNPQAILITGLAGLLAGASSMSLGEWLSVQSSRELYSHRIQQEEQSLKKDPQAEAARIAAIFGRKGLSASLSAQVAGNLLRDPQHALDTLVREEIGVDPDELGGSAWEAAGVSFVLFAFGAIVPVLPYIFMTGLAAMLLSIGMSALALFLTGATITLLTGRNPIYSGLRQVLFGSLAAAVTYGIGRLIGVAVG